MKKAFIHMSEKPSRETLLRRVKALESCLGRTRAEIDTLKGDQVELAAVLAHTPLCMLLVGEDCRVIRVSNAVFRLTGRKEEEIRGVPCGEALRCVYHLDDPRGCGFGPACQSCTVRQTVTDTLATGSSHYQVEADISMLDDPVGKRTLLVSTALLETLEKKAIVFLEDITDRKRAEKRLRASLAKQGALLRGLKRVMKEIKTLRGILPICASCKKIRDDDGYWNQIEAYIQEHSEAKFTHGVCPDCARRLYPDLNDHDY